jgi:DNA-binding LacI/PurR family transcriptional regulator
MKDSYIAVSNSPIPLYYQVKKMIISELMRRNLKTGDIIPKEMDLCKKYDVSRITVRRAIAELVSEGVLYRVSGVGTFIKELTEKDFHISGKDRQIALVVPDIEDLAISAIFSGIDIAAQKHDYEIIIYSSGRRIEKENYNLSHLLQSNSTGAIIFPNWGTANVSHIFELKRQGFPFVLIDRYFREIETDYVVTDNIAGAFDAVTHLIRLGHKRIGFIGGLDNSAGNDRMEGYKKALSKNGIVVDEDLITALDKNNYSRLQTEPDSGGYRETKNLLKLKNRVTAIFAASDGIAIGAMRAIKDAGLKIPDDVAVVGFDNLKYASLLEVPLTTVAQPFKEIGQKAIEILISKIEGKSKELNQIILKPELVIRKTCGGISPEK